MPDPVTLEERAAWAALCAAATPGPWFHGWWSGQCHIKHQHGLKHGCVYDPVRYEHTHEDGECRYRWGIASEVPRCMVVTTHYDELDISDADAAFIAAAREAVPRLLAALAEAEREREACRALLTGPPPRMGPCSASNTPPDFRHG